MSETRSEIAERSHGWDCAIQKRDVTEVQEFLHENYALVLVQPAASVLPREQWLAMLPDYVVDEWDIQEQVIDVDGEVAVVLQRVNMKASVLGRDRSGIFVTSDTWRRTAGSWRVWRRHSTPLTASELPLPEVS